MKNFIILITLIFAFASFAKDNTITMNFDVNTANKHSDILFVIDDSGSMADNQAKLKSVVKSFVKSLNDISYNIYAVSTDIDRAYTGNLISSYRTD